MLDKIFCGDCDEGMAGIRDGSVDIIFTDPPYIQAEYATAYRILAKHAFRLLIEGGFLITYCPQFYLPDIALILGESELVYYWLVAQLNHGGKPIVWSRRVQCHWKPIIIYQKPSDSTHHHHVFSDAIRGLRSKRYHPWEQSIHESLHLLSRIGKPGCVVLDPFAGSGTNLLAAKLLGQRYIGFEIDPDTCETARDRLTQQPIDLSTFSEVDILP